MKFRGHLLDNTFKSVYGLAVADINGDGQLDIIAGSTGEPIVAWYEAPALEKTPRDRSGQRTHHNRALRSHRQWRARSHCRERFQSWCQRRRRIPPMA